MKRAYNSLIRNSAHYDSVATPFGGVLHAPFERPNSFHLKYVQYIICLALLWPVCGYAQTDPHYTMFMFNKQIYNPAYTGSREVTSVNAVYRDQWTGIDGAPKTVNVSVEGLIGSHLKPDRKVALGLSINHEEAGVENNTDIMAYYAYRVHFSNSTLSLGMRGGAKLYSVYYSQLDPYQQLDPDIAHDIKSAFLPNFGAGMYWSGDRFFLGVSVPNLAQNYYDKNGHSINSSGTQIGLGSSKEIRGYYANGGLVFPVNDHIKIEPQVLLRYMGNDVSNLPLSCDFNVSAIAYDRIMFGFTYRTDLSFAGLLHMQVTHNVNIGYSYDYKASNINICANGSHEIIIGYDFAWSGSRSDTKFTTPRFIKSF